MIHGDENSDEDKDEVDWDPDDEDRGEWSTRECSIDALDWGAEEEQGYHPCRKQRLERIQVGMN